MRVPRLSADGRICLYVVVVLAAQLAIYRAKVWYPDRDVSYDGPYHIAMADLFGPVACQRTFPATYQSIWAEHFADSELGFHFLLCSLRRWAGLFGYRGNAPPFVLETACLVLGLMAAFSAALVAMNVRQAFVFLPLLLFSCPLFTLRINLVRPHCVAVIVMVLTAALLAERVDLKRHLWRMGILGFLFAYVRADPHFILLPTGCYALVALPSRGWKALWPAAAALLGVAAGLTLHPQFPNTFLIWKIQCLAGAWQHLMQRGPVMLGPVDSMPPGWPLLVHNLAVVLLAAITLGVVVRRDRRGHAVPLPQRFFLLLSVASLVGFVFSRRMIECAVPFTVIAAALVYRDVCGSRSWRFHLACLAATLGLGVALTPLHLRYQGDAGVPIPRQFAAWARERIPAGDRIANFCWDDFPHLFFAAPEYSYSYGIDPLFAWSADPANFQRIERLATGVDPLPAGTELMGVLQARLVFVGIRHHLLARAMAEAGIALAYQGIDGWCFDLAAPPVNHGLHGENR